MNETKDIKLSRKIYKEEGIMQVKELFSELVEVNMSKDEKYHIIRLAGKSQEHPLDSVAGEFANQCLIASRNIQNDK